MAGEDTCPANDALREENRGEYEFLLSKTGHLSTTPT